jgi:hypothetical protein
VIKPFAEQAEGFCTKISCDRKDSPTSQGEIMIVLNFSHPLTDAQCQQIEKLSEQSIDTIITVLTEFDVGNGFVAQCIDLLDRLAINPLQWQQAAWLVIPPSLNFITAVLLAELHGRMGHFLTIARTRPVPGSTPTQYEVAEVINLQDVRDEARKHRS